MAADTCVLVCTGCVIGGSCYGEAQANPANRCQACDSARSKSAWSNLADGTPCDDGRFCTVGDACAAGVCLSTARGCGDGVACNGTETCDEGSASCKPGTSTCSGAEVCDLAKNACVCNDCLYEGACYPEGGGCDDHAPCSTASLCSKDQCLPSTVVPECAADPLCLRACQEVGVTVPYFVTSASPTVLPTAGGVPMTLNGFFGNPSKVVVRRLGLPLTVLSSSGVKVVVAGPAGSTDTALTVTAEGNQAVPLLEQDATGKLVARPTIPVSYLPPVVTSVSGCVADVFPRALDCDLPGQKIVVHGQQFGNDAAQLQVSVGGVACSNVMVAVPHTVLTCDLAASPAGGVDLDLTVTRAGMSGTLAQAVSFWAPTVVDVSPTVGSTPAAATPSRSRSARAERCRCSSVRPARSTPAPRPPRRAPPSSAPCLPGPACHTWCASSRASSSVQARGEDRELPPALAPAGHASPQPVRDDLDHLDPRPGSFLRVLRRLEPAGDPRPRFFSVWIPRMGWARRSASRP
ncbi:MAG: IPT/TIG domain-containing protein [Thermomicrobiales bacterium]